VAAVAVRVSLVKASYLAVASSMIEETAKDLRTCPREGYCAVFYILVVL